MSLIERLMFVAKAWAAANDRSLARLATVVVNDGKFFARIEAPAANVTTTTLERFARFLASDANWPDGSRAPQCARDLATAVFGRPHDEPTTGEIRAFPGSEAGQGGATPAALSGGRDDRVLICDVCEARLDGDAARTCGFVDCPNVAAAA